MSALIAGSHSLRLTAKGHVQEDGDPRREAKALDDQRTTARDTKLLREMYVRHNYLLTKH